MKQRDQRKPEDREVITVYGLKKLQPRPFDLVAADGTCAVISDEIKIVIEKGIAEIAHGQRGLIRDAPDGFTAPGTADA